MPIPSEQTTSHDLQTQCQAVMAAIPTHATTSSVFSVRHSTYNTNKSDVTNTNFAHPSRSFLRALHHFTQKTSQSLHGLASFVLLVECLKPLWFILDSLVLILLQAMSLCCSGTNITYPRSRVVRPWGLEILYWVSGRSILMLNYARCGHRNWSHGCGWWQRSGLPTLVYCCTRLETE